MNGLAVSASGVAVGGVLRSAVRRPRWLRRGLLGATAAGLAVCCASLATELSLRAWFVESNGAGVTLASQRWLDEHWKPINPLGFRDRPVSEQELVGRKIAWVVGDSYAAGWGIEDVGDRFSDRLAARLGDGWRVFTIAKPGWDTRRQIEAASTFPHRPDLVVHAYCLNDAERAAEQAGARMLRTSAKPTSRVGAAVVSHSHLANVLYWRWWSLRSQAASRDYWHFIEDCYAEGPAWESHTADLCALLEVYRQSTANIVAFAIPNLLDVEASRPMTHKIEAWFEANGVRCVGLSDRLADEVPTSMVVNRFDPHANERVHGMIAELLFDEIAAAGLNRPGS